MKPKVPSIPQPMPEQGAPDAVDDSDREIREHCQRGEYHRATVTAMRRYGRECYAFIYGVLGSVDVDDANQELWAAIVVGIAKFEGRASFRTWAYSIAWRICSEFLHDRYRQRLHSPLSAVPEVLAFEAKIRSQSAPYLQSAMKSAVMRIRESLLPEERMLLILRVDRNLAWRDIAHILADPQQPTELDEQRLRKRYGRIKKKIQEEARKAGLTDST